MLDDLDHLAHAQESSNCLGILVEPLPLIDGRDLQHLVFPCV